MAWLDSIWAQMVAGVGIFVSINLLFFKSDEFFSKEFKEDISLRLLCLGPSDTDGSWPSLLTRLFDRIFNKRQKANKQLPEWRLFVSWKTFLLSGVASRLAVALVTVIGLTLGPVSDDVPRERLHLSGVIAVIALMLNVTAGCLSLLETRYLLNWLSGGPPVPRLAGRLFLDTVVTAAIIIGFGFSLFVLFLVVVPGMKAPDYLGDFGCLFSAVVAPYDVLSWLKDTTDRGSNIVGIFTYAAFFTSIWLWLFGLSQFVVTVACRTGPSLKVVRHVLLIDERPFRNLGIIAGLIATLAYWVFAAYQRGGVSVA